MYGNDVFFKFNFHMKFSSESMPIGLLCWHHLPASVIAMILKSLDVITLLFLMTIKYPLKMGLMT